MHFQTARIVHFGTASDNAKVVPTPYPEQVLHSLLSMFTERARQSTNANHKAGQLNTYTSS